MLTSTLNEGANSFFSPVPCQDGLCIHLALALYKSELILDICKNKNIEILIKLFSF